jgi:hypothetical protein
MGNGERGERRERWTPLFQELLRKYEKMVVGRGLAPADISKMDGDV